jgi:hypothetical protein
VLDEYESNNDPDGDGKTNLVDTDDDNDGGVLWAMT